MKERKDLKTTGKTSKGKKPGLAKTEVPTSVEKHDGDDGATAKETADVDDEKQQLISTRSSEHKFQELWLQDCYTRSYTVGSTWLRLQRKLESNMVDMLDKDLKTTYANCYEKFTCICLKDNFPETSFNINAIKTTKAQREKLLNEAKEWIDVQVDTASRVYYAESYEKTSKCSSTAVFMANVYHLLLPRLDKQIFDTEQETRLQTGINNFMEPCGAHTNMISTSAFEVALALIGKIEIFRQQLHGVFLPLVLRRVVWEDGLSKIRAKQITSPPAKSDQSRTSSTEKLSDLVDSLVKKIKLPVQVADKVKNRAPTVLAVVEDMLGKVTPGHVSLLLPLMYVTTGTNNLRYEAECVYFICKEHLSNDRVQRVAGSIVEELSVKQPLIHEHICSLAPGGGINEEVALFASWIAEGFVGFVRWEVVLFIWDQLFISSWSDHSMKITCLLLVKLLQDSILEAFSWDDICKCFNEEASNLYLSDVQLAWKYLHSGKDINALHDAFKPESQISQEEPTYSTVGRSSPLTNENRPSIGAIWEPRLKSVLTLIPQATSTWEPFDVYIDQCRFLTDNASVIKVVGRVLNPGDNIIIPDILAFPLLNSTARCPSFVYRHTINKERKQLNPKAILLLRVYTVDVDTCHLVVIGSCLLSLFKNENNEKAVLNVGGHQLRLHAGLPTFDDLSQLKSTDMDTNLTIPAVTLLVRLLPHIRKLVQAPVYKHGYYDTDNTYPTISEEELHLHYTSSTDYPHSVRDALKVILAAKKLKCPEDDEAFSVQYKEILDQKQLQDRKPEHLNPGRCVVYDKAQGIAVQIKGAHGLPAKCEGMFVLAFGRIVPGSIAMESPKDPSLKEMIYTQHIDYTSLQKCPKWLDGPMVIHPQRDTHTCLLVSLYGMQGIYLPKTGGKPSKIVTLDGKPCDIPGCDIYLGFGIIPLFRGKYVLPGKFVTPLFKSWPSDEFLESQKQNNIASVVKSTVKHKELKLLEGSCIEVWICDGHFEIDEAPSMPVRDYLLDVASRREKYLKSITGDGINSEPYSALVMKYLSPEVQSGGTESEEYQHAERDHQRLFGKALTKLVFQRYFGSA